MGGPNVIPRNVHPVQAGSPPRRAPAPVPLLPATVGLLIGIALADYTQADPLRVALLVGAGLAITLLVALTMARRIRGASVWLPSRSLTSGCVVAIFAAVGVERYVAVTALPVHHVTHIATDEPTLTRLQAIVRSEPRAIVSEQRNAFVAFPSTPRVGFLAQAQALTAAGGSTPLTGLIDVTVATDQLDLATGATVELSGELERPSPPMNPGEVDWRRWNALRGVHARLRVRDDAHCRVLKPARRNWRDSLTWQTPDSEAIDTETSDETARRLLDVVVLGRRSEAGRELNRRFAEAGVAHYLAASGFHVGVVAGAAWLLGRAVLRSRRSAAVVVAGVLLLYAFIADPNAPVLRAASMGLLAVVAVFLNRPMSIVNWLALAASGIVLWTPLALFQPSFQLSFVVVAALLAVTPLVLRFRWRDEWRDMSETRDVHGYAALARRRARQWVSGAAVVSVVAWLASAPLSLWHFGAISWFGALNSILLAPLVAVLAPLGLAATLLRTIVPPAAPVADLVVPLAEVLVSAAAGLQSLGGYARMAPPPVWLLVATYALAAVAVALLRRWRTPGGSDANAPVRARLVWLTLGVSLTTIGGLWGGWLLTPGVGARAGLELYVLSVGDGQAVIARGANGNVVVCDAGARANRDAGEVVLDALRDLRWSTPRAVFATAARAEQLSGLPTILTQTPAATLYAGPSFPMAYRAAAPTVRRFLRLAQRELDSVRLLAQDRSVRIDGFDVRAIVPHAEYDDAQASLPLLLEVEGRGVLLVGKPSRRSLETLVDAWPPSEFDIAAVVIASPTQADRAALRELLQTVESDAVIVSSRRDRPVLTREDVPKEASLWHTGSHGAIRLSVFAEGDMSISRFRGG